MKYFLILLVASSILFSEENTEVGRYQLEVTTYQNNKGKIYIVETVLDTKTGKVVKRKKIYASKYKLPYKNRSGRTVYSE